MTARKDFEVAIIGGGIAGITLAIALHERNVPFQIYEQAEKFGEVGAGVSFTQNAVQAMKACHPGIYEAFERVCTRNLWPSKEKVWFDYLDGYGDSSLTAAGHQEAAFTITSPLGQAGVHRAHFLDELVKLLPAGVAHFGKRLKDIVDTGGAGRPGRKFELAFEDGSRAAADAVVGCDGIKSKVRELLFGRDHPCSRPTYSHKYAYRGLIPMDRAIAAIGAERAQNACMHMGPGGHVLTFPVNHGRTLNIVAFHTSAEPWTTTTTSSGRDGSGRLTRPATRDQALADFAGYGHNVRALLAMTEAQLDCWAIFHLADHPVPRFNAGAVVLSGDAAHATSPHHGAGAGFCIEDSAALATLLQAATRVDDLPAAFDTFDRVRRARGHWLVQSSHFIGNAYEWLADGCGRDFARIEAEINRRNDIISHFDVDAMCREAAALLAQNLKHAAQRQETESRQEG